MSADRIKQLVLVEVQHLLEPGQIRSESRQLTQAKDGAAEEEPAERGDDEGGADSVSAAQLIISTLRFPQ